MDHVLLLIDLSLRQCLDHYAFCAGKNLPNKEFRYYSTIIVTVVVHQDFSHQLLYHQVTNLKIYCNDLISPIN